MKGLLKMKYEVLVQLKEEVLDPEGRAIEHNLQSLGFKEIKAIKVSKRYIIEVNDSKEESEQLLEKISKKFLSNPTSQTYTLNRLN